MSQGRDVRGCRSVVFVTRLERNSPSTVHRCYMLANELKKLGIASNVICRADASPIHVLKEGMKSDAVVFQRYFYYLAPLFLLIFRMVGRKTIFDMDDALFLSPLSQTHKWLKGPMVRLLTNFMLRFSSVVVVGSHFLRDHSVRLNEYVHFIPTPVDSELFSPRKQSGAEDKDCPILGSFGTGDGQVDNLKVLKKSLEILFQKTHFRLVLLGCARAKKVRKLFGDVPFPVDFGPDYWIEFEKIPHWVSKFHINLYPLSDSPWSKGKCGMKILEAMSMEIPSVASRFGENVYIIDDGVDGFLASDPVEWANRLFLLLRDSELRAKLGKAGRVKIERRYCLKVVVKKYASLLQS